MINSTMCDFYREPDKLFDPTLTIIIVGDTNASKTTFFNTFLKKLYGGNYLEFYASSGSDKTKRSTIFHFNNRHHFKYIIKNVPYDKYMNYKEFQKEYNDYATNDYIVPNCTEIIDAYLPTQLNEIFNIIDTVGKSTKVDIREYNLALEELKAYYPNHLIVNMTRMSSIDKLRSTNEVTILTHADIIDYDKDESIKASHEQFREYVGKSLFVYSNFLESKLINFGNGQVLMYGYDNCDLMIKHITTTLFQENFYQYIVKNLNEVEHDEFINNAQCIDKILEHLKVYNDSVLIKNLKEIINDYKMVSLTELTIQYDDVIKNRTDHEGKGIGIETKYKQMCNYSANKYRILNNIITDTRKKHDEEYKLSKDFVLFDKMVLEMISEKCSIDVKIIRREIVRYTKDKMVQIEKAEIEKKEGALTNIILPPSPVISYSSPVISYSVPVNSPSSPFNPSKKRKLEETTENIV